MEWYASAMELSVWTESSVTQAEQDDQGYWTIKINKGGRDERTLHPKHVVSLRYGGELEGLS
jgi:elongation factor P hydroxylase